MIRLQFLFFITVMTLPFQISHINDLVPHQVVQGDVVQFFNPPSCPNGCLKPLDSEDPDQETFARIAHYHALDATTLQHPFNLTRPYDPIPGQSSCKVVVLPRSFWDKSRQLNSRDWLPCWLVSSRLSIFLGYI